jgi:hypothetical protein
MGTKKGKGKAAPAKAPEQTTSAAGTIKGTAGEIVDEVEKASGVVLGEVRSSIGYIGGKLTDTAKAAAGATVAVKDRVISKEVSDQLISLAKDVEEVGESLLKVISSHFTSLRDTVIRPAAKTTTKKKAAARRKAKTKTKQQAKVKAKRVTRKKAAPKRTTGAASGKTAKVTAKRATRKKAAAKSAGRAVAKKKTRVTATRRKAAAR